MLRSIDIACFINILPLTNNSKSLRELEAEKAWSRGPDNTAHSFNYNYYYITVYKDTFYWIVLFSVLHFGDGPCSLSSQQAAHIQYNNIICPANTTDRFDVAQGLIS